MSWAETGSCRNDRCGGVIQGFGFQHNRVEAAAQDYELAKVDYRAACDGFDGTDERSVQRFNAAIDRRRAAWERYQFYKFGI